MRKNKNYVPSDIQMIHVREVLQLMSALTKDARFEEASNEVEKGEVIHTMNEWLDRALDNGRQEGRIIEYIDIRREDGYSDEKIINGLMKRFHLTDGQAKEYVQGLVSVKL